MTEKLLHNPHAGDILKHAFIDEMQTLNATKLARAIDVPPSHIYAIIQGKQAVDADIDARLCKYFKLSAGYFTRLQDSYHKMEAKRGENISLRPTRASQNYVSAS